MDGDQMQYDQYDDMGDNSGQYQDMYGDENQYGDEEGEMVRYSYSNSNLGG